MLTPMKGTNFKRAGGRPSVALPESPSASSSKSPRAESKEVGWQRFQQIDKKRTRDFEHRRRVRPKSPPGVSEYALERGDGPAYFHDVITVAHQIAPGPGPETQVFSIHNELADAQVEPADSRKRRGLEERDELYSVSLRRT